MKNKELKLKTGTITEAELVEMFASPAVKKRYEDTGKFSSGNVKNTTLDKAKRVCHITDNHDKTYTIRRIYEFQMPVHWPRMNDGLYQHMIPLFLDKLKESHDKKAISFTLGHWAEEIDLINENYILGKKQKNTLAEHIKVAYPLVYDFYSHVDDMINYYMANTMLYLKKNVCIEYEQVFYAIYEQRTIGQIDHNGVFTQNVNFVVKRMDQQEMEFYADCLTKADLKFGINNDSERYYSKSAAAWSEYMKQLLYEKRNIKSVFQTYMVYPLSEAQRDHIRKLYGRVTTKTLSNRLVKDFSAMIQENAGKRYQKDTNGKYMVTEEQFHKLYNKMCRVLIDPNAEPIRPYIGKTSMLEDYKIETTGGNVTYES